MPRIVRQNSALVSLIGAVALAGIAIWWISATPTPAGAMPAAIAVAFAPPPLDPVIAGEIETLRNDVGLGNDALNVLNLDEPADLLGELKTWHANNREELNSRRTALADLRGQIRLLQSAINNGEDQSSELVTARAALAQGESGLETFLATMQETVLGELTTEQRETIARVKSQRTLPMPYRALPLNQEQTSALRKALLKQEQRRSTARTDERRAEVLSLFQQERDAAIGETNLQLLESIQSYLGASSGRVVAAVNEVLPTSDE